jgi:hypothetical protein
MCIYIGNSTGLVDRVREKYPVDNQNQGDTKYGPSGDYLCIL